MTSINKFGKVASFLPRFTRAIFNKDTPVLAKFLAFFAIFYAISPADLISDLVPFLGLLDDAIVLPFLIYLASSLIPDELMEEKENKDHIKDEEA